MARIVRDIIVSIDRTVEGVELVAGKTNVVDAALARHLVASGTARFAETDKGPRKASESRSNSAKKPRAKASDGDAKTED